MSEVDLTAVRDLVTAMARADAEIRRVKQDLDKLTRLRDQIRDQLSRLMGNNEVGLVNGAAVLKRTTSKQFATAQFRTENPDLYELVKTYDMKEIVDTDKLVQIAPSVYEKYLTVRWTNTMEVDNV